MKKFIFSLILLSVLMLGVSTVETWAQKPLKGTWLFTVKTPVGDIPTSFSFKAKGKGSFTTPQGTLQLAYRESTKNASFSVVLEAPGLAPDGSDLSIIIRGTKKDDKNVTGAVYFISDTPMASSAVGFAVLTGSVIGVRQ